MPSAACARPTSGCGRGSHLTRSGSSTTAPRPPAQSQIAALMSDGARRPMPTTAVLGALQQIHWAIHRAFCEYQSACEERRQLAVDVGELSQQLIEVLCAAGCSADDARDADVHELAGAGIR